MLKFLECISAEFTALMEEDKAMVRASLQGSLDVTDTAAQSMASAVTMR